MFFFLSCLCVCVPLSRLVSVSVQPLSARAISRVASTALPVTPLHAIKQSRRWRSTWHVYLSLHAVEAPHAIDATLSP